MTQLEQVLSKKAFAALEQIRRARGIRSRAKALEMILLEHVFDDESDDRVVLSPADAAIFEKRKANMEAGQFVEATDVWRKLRERREAGQV